jgi:threonine dehydrogenase-like Zn-dependent dehydrogenase
MIITYFGKEFFKIQQGDLVVAMNPISKDSKEKVSRFGSRIALSTTNNPDYNGFESVAHGDTIPLEIAGPGDYEAQGIFIKGVMTETELDGKKYITTIYSLSIDGISLCFLGPLSNAMLSAETLGEIDPPDIVFVPIGGSGTIGAADAYKLALSLDAKVIIPMEFDEKLLKAFLKEGGQETVAPIEKLTIKAKELIGREGEIIVLSS